MNTNQYKIKPPTRGEIITLKMRRAGITYQDVCRHFKVTRAAVSNAINGKSERLLRHIEIDFDNIVESKRRGAA
jgi:plasmid maintenance system antidote protein VapI